MIVYSDGPKLNDGTDMGLHACFYFRGKNRKKVQKAKRAG